MFFNDTAKGKTIGEGMYDGGADVVYAAAGGSGGGLFQAAAEKSKWAIGVDSDQYQSYPDQQKWILTHPRASSRMSPIRSPSDFSRRRRHGLQRATA